MKIQDAKVLVLATDGVEQSELTTPRDRLREAGAHVDVVAPKERRQKGTIRGWDMKDWGEEIPVDKDLESIDPEDYDALVLPGGVINPDHLRTNPRAVELVRNWYDSGKPLAAICHGPWLLAEAGILDGKRVTSYNSIRTDIINAGANWQDAAVVVDNGLITSRNPGDLEPFSKKIIEEIQEGRHQRSAA